MTARIHNTWLQWRSERGWGVQNYRLVSPHATRYGESFGISTFVDRLTIIFDEVAWVEAIHT